MIRPDAVAAHSYWFHITKGPRYFAGLDEIREPHAVPPHSPGQRRITDDRNDGDRNERTFGDASLGRIPGSVWDIPPFDLFPFPTTIKERQPMTQDTPLPAPLTADAVVDFEGEGAVILRHDARALPLDDESVDLIVTSPPYFALRSYRDACGTCGGGRIDCLECHGTGRGHYDGQLGSEDTPAEFIANLIDCMREWVRVLKPSGSMFVNLGDKYSQRAQTRRSSHQPGIFPDKFEEFGQTWKERREAGAVPKDNIMANGISVPEKSRMLLPHRFAIACIDELGLIVRSDMVWSKPNGLPESVTDRVRSSHEYWFHVVKQGRYFAGLDEIRTAYAPSTLASYESGGLRSSIGDGTHPSKSQGGKQRLDGDNLDDYSGNPLGRPPGSVWDIPSEPLIIPDEVREARNLPDHFAAFPQEWPRRLILGWSPVGYCTECDEPRRATTSKAAPSTWEVRQGKGESASYVTGNTGLNHAGGHPQSARQTTITGYVCDCPPIGNPAPTRPAVILDPFGGTGTTAGVARTLGRFGISNDLSADYNRLAAWRIFESGHFTKTEQRTWADKQGRLL